MILKRLRRSSTDRDDGGFVIIQVLMLMLIIESFMLLMLTQYTEEIRQTQFSRKHEQTLNNALAGLNAGLNQMRNAVSSGSTIGVISRLPSCTAGTNKVTITGAVDSAGTQTWSTNIYYFITDPTLLAPLGSVLTAGAMPCPLGSTVPRYAYLVSTGSSTASPATAGDRTLHAVYTFNTSNAVTPGGQVIASPSGTCWDAGSSPTVGTLPTWQLCQVTGTPSQSWYYRGDLTIQWMGDPSSNLCLQRPASLAAGPNNLTLQTCLGSGTSATAYTAGYSPPAKQYQEFPTQDSWAVAANNGSRDDSYCITSYTTSGGTYSAAAVNDRMVVAARPDCLGVYTGAPGAASTSQVGAGAASGVTDGFPGQTTQQIANLKYGNHCLDLYNGNVSANNPLGVVGRGGPLVAYTCGQAPDYTLIAFNKRFAFNRVSGNQGQFTVFCNGIGCGSNRSSCFESAGAYLVAATCVTGRTQQTFTFTGLIRGNYAGSYLIRDYAGNCLTADVPTQRSGALGSTSVQACTGGDEQKWNAPPNSTASVLAGIGEN